MGEKIAKMQTELCIEQRLPRWALLEIEQAKKADATWSARKLRGKLQAVAGIRKNMRTATAEKQAHESHQVQSHGESRKLRTLEGAKRKEFLRCTSALPAAAKQQAERKGKEHESVQPA
ncbi:hypothetical protein Tcan_04092 [Toxocara canis]|uniref:Uncharacterized protein n=1 Tax=Toxocara canis TaxID=6265 RepID=A0A0B2W632_TOXCA|nr:hypothetical protein Tcan_04092 [Toxocara canis]